MRSNIGGIRKPEIRHEQEAGNDDEIRNPEPGTRNPEEVNLQQMSGILSL
ncbi:Hypothetical predicted protein [Pelobates cultripes]|uniref:Uncharacterized protein n=1 Tax=Pelobates cultripes TaxID=61616 RepID=A0AAD1SFU8_PELCU|nr:Hypothetical predicted protein [Pelobates cultripes]